MKRKVSSITLFIFVAAIILAGCTGGGGQGGKGNGQGEIDGAKGKPVEFSVFIPGSGGNPPQEEDLILRKLSEDLNVKMNFNIVTTEYDQSLTAKVAGGTPPDVFGADKRMLKRLVDQNLVLELGNYLDRMPNIKKSYTSVDFSKGMYKGKMYALPKRSDIQMFTYWVRADWMQNLNLKMPSTLEQFKQMLIAFTKNDPDKNGKEDTYGLTGAGIAAFTGIFTAFGVADPGNWMIKDNKVVYSTTDPAMKDALAFIAELIDAKVVDPELITNQNPRDKAFKGNAGVIYINWPSMATDAVKKMYTDINPKAEWVQMNSFKGPGGNYQGMWDVGRNPAMIVLSKSLEKDQHKLNKILEFLNYITDPGEGQLTVNYGIDGVHYKKENGKIVTLPAISNTAYAWQMQLTGRSEMEYLKVKFPGQIKEIEFAMNQPNLLVYTGFVPVPEDVVIDNRYEQEELIKFIYRKRQLSEYDSFAKTLNDQFHLPARLREADKSLRDLGYIK